MKIFSSIESGSYRSLRSWKGVMIFWLFLLIMVSIFTVPLKGALKTAFGGSMITENLSEGFNPEVFSDLGSVFRSAISFATSGFIFVVLLGFIAGAFITGGLFNSIKRDCRDFSAAEFFRAGAQNFRSFLLISLIVVLITCCLTAVLSGVTYSIIGSMENSGERTSFLIGTAGALIFLFILPVLLLVADYSRAWKAANADISGFKALGFGFSQTFRRFWPSYLMMLVMILLQLLLGFAAFKIFPSWNPASSGSVFVYFLLSQLTIFVRILFRTCRYASVTSLMEEDLHKTILI
jgi:uncharacterized membrane protein YeaQ/YmgE (transglycosylase-associated protein family)